MCSRCLLYPLLKEIENSPGETELNLSGILAFLLVMIITSIHAKRATSMNPAVILKYE